MSLRRLRSGELLALAGVACVIVALTRPWYENASGKLDAWATFGPALAVLVVAAAVALALVLATVTERSTALPIAAAIWSTLFGVLAVIAAVVRVIERPEHATALCAGSWLGLTGAIVILIGSWQSMRDERTGRYPPLEIQRRAPPPA